MSDLPARPRASHPSTYFQESSKRWEKTVLLAGFSLALGVSADPVWAQKTLVASPADAVASDPDLTFDGRMTSFLLGGQIWLARPDGSEETQIPVGNITNHSMDANGAVFAIADYSEYTRIFNRRTGQLVTVTPFVPNIRLVRITASGTRVAFGGGPVFVVDADGTNLTQVSGGNAIDHLGPSITSGGDLLAYVEDECVGTPTCVFNDHVFVGRADGSGDGPVTTEPYVDRRAARISNDGSVILFERDAHDRTGWHLGAVASDGTNERTLTALLPVPPIVYNCPFGCDISDLSGDGTTAVFSNKYLSQLKGGVYVLRTDGSGLRLLDYGGPMVAINGDGSVVAYTRDEAGGARRICVTGVPGFAPKELYDLTFSEDAQTLSWTDSPLANSHNLYRGDLQLLRSGDFGACFLGSLTSPTASDPTIPAPGHGFFYLVTGENGTGEGTAGHTSAGTARMPSLSCLPADSDGDGVVDASDNCPLRPNPSQIDSDGDSLGNLCDNCPPVANNSQVDGDSDRIGDPCDDNDLDSDGVLNYMDNCPTVPNANQRDNDGNGKGDACDNPNKDTDHDGQNDSVDNCPLLANPSQQDADGDGIGDACDPEDYDGDGVMNFQDNCPTIANPAQTDTDGDGLGDACESE